jgi:hypothetical protein
MHKENQAVQAMLSLNLETLLTANPAQGRIEENIDQDISNQAEDEESYSEFGKIQEIDNQAEDEEEFGNIQEADNEGEIEGEI